MSEHKPDCICVNCEGLKARLAEAERKVQARDLCVQGILALCADWLDDDKFNNVERQALDAGVPYPPRVTDSASVEGEK